RSPQARAGPRGEPPPGERGSRRSAPQMPDQPRRDAPCAEAMSARRAGGTPPVPEVRCGSAGWITRSVRVRLGPDSHDRDDAEGDQRDDGDVPEGPHLLLMTIIPIVTAAAAAPNPAIARTPNAAADIERPSRFSSTNRVAPRIANENTSVTPIPAIAAATTVFH